MTPVRVTLTDLEHCLAKAADLLCGSTDQADFRAHIFPPAFLKGISRVYQGELPRGLTSPADTTYWQARSATTTASPSPRTPGARLTCRPESLGIRADERFYPPSFGLLINILDPRKGDLPLNGRTRCAHPGKLTFNPVDSCKEPCEHTR